MSYILRTWFNVYHLDTIHENIMQDIICDKSINGNVRHLGIIYLKNGVDKYWRKTASQYVIHNKVFIHYMLISTLTGIWTDFMGLC